MKSNNSIIDLGATWDLKVTSSKGADAGQPTLHWKRPKSGTYEGFILDGCKGSGASDQELRGLMV